MRKRAGGILILLLLLGVMLVGYGKGQNRYTVWCTDIPGYGVDVEDRETQEKIIDSAFDEYWDTLPERQPRVVMKYGEGIFPAAYSDEVIEAEYTDDLSLLKEMNQTNHSYACQDGKVYFRQYHKECDGVDALGGEYPVTDGEKAMICVDQEGVARELFKDKGWGDFYLIGDRFYMMECRKVDWGSEYRIYSVNREGNERIDYGIGEIKAVDEAKDILILEMQEGRHGLVSDIRVLDCVSGDCKSMGSLLKEDGRKEGEEFVHWGFEAYQDGWLYLSCRRSDGKPGSVCATDLYAVSLEGVWQKVITLASDKTYAESIIQLEVLEDRLFFTYGGYDGTAHFFQGGSIISVKRDGTDYRAIQDIAADRPTSEDVFLLRQDAGRTLVYFGAAYYTADSRKEGEDADYLVTVWDVDTGTLYPSTFPVYPAYNAKKGIYLDTRDHVCALPDRTGRIVRVVENLYDYLEMPEENEGERNAQRLDYDVYYADGYLYFTTDYEFDSEEYRKGWETAYYRLKLGEEQAELLLRTVNREREEKYYTELLKTQVKVEMDGKSSLSGYCDKVIETEYTDDLSLLEQSDRMSHQYAYRDGKVYYRKYRKDSFGESSHTYENYSYLPVAGAEKEMVCIDRDGVQTALFTDKGQGDFYLIGNRFYMTDSEVYSVDMNGQGRRNYGKGEILAADGTGRFLVLELRRDGHDFRRPDYCALNCDTGECKSLLSEEYFAREEEDGYWSFEAYQDGWVYLSFFRRRGGTAEYSETTLYAVSLDGKWNRVITLTSDMYYGETVVGLQALGDRLFFLFGGYDGSRVWYQGGKIVTVKRDGTDYRSIEEGGNDFFPADHFYLRQDGEKIWVYYPDFYHITEEAVDTKEERYVATVWDIDTGMRYPSDMPACAVTKPYRYDLFMDYIFMNGEGGYDVYALPDRTGRLVRVAKDLDRCVKAGAADGYGENASLEIRDLYYRDGYLYFKAEYSRWGGWEEGGWLRLGTECYRLKPGEEKAELLYEY